MKIWIDIDQLKSSDKFSSAQAKAKFLSRTFKLYIGFFGVVRLMTKGRQPEAKQTLSEL